MGFTNATAYTNALQTRCIVCCKPMPESRGGNVHEGCLPRTQYRIRIGKRWLKSLVCQPGGAVLTDSHDDAGLFDGPERLKGSVIKYAPAMTTALVRQLLGIEGRVWCKPLAGPGFWSF